MKKGDAASLAIGGQGSKRDEYLYRMWKLAGEWED
jgi:hypothetical protein